MSGPAWSPPSIDSVHGAAAQPLTQRLWVTCYGEIGTNKNVFGFSAAQQSASGMFADSASVVSTPSSQGTQPNSYQAIAFAANGDMWLGTWGSNLTQKPQAIIKLTPAQYNGGGPVAPSVVLTMPGLDNDDASVNALAFDSSGGLWVAFGNSSGTGRVRKFSSASLLTTGSPTPSVVISSTSTLLGPTDLVFDNAGNLFATALITGKVIRLGGAQLLASDSAIVPSASMVMGTACDGLAYNGNLWVADFDSGTVSCYNGNSINVSGTPTPLVVLSGIAGNPEKLAFDARGNLWVSLFDNAVIRFDIDQLSSSGAKSPRARLTGAGALSVPYSLRFAP